MTPPSPSKNSNANEPRLVESYGFKSTDDAPNPIPTKAMLRSMGLPAGECRLPMGPTPAGLEDRARKVLANLSA